MRDEVQRSVRRFEEIGDLVQERVRTQRLTMHRGQRATVNKAIGDFEQRISTLEDLVSRTVRASEGHAEEAIQDVTMTALQKEAEDHHVWTMKKVQKLEDESRAAVRSEARSSLALD